MPEMAEARERSRSPIRANAEQAVLKGLKAFVVNLDRRSDRWERCATMLKDETPWMEFERFSASDGSKIDIPEKEVVSVWNTKENALYGDYDEWVYDAPDTPLDGTPWKFPCDIKENDPEWSIEEDEECEEGAETGTITKTSTKETWKVKKAFAQRFVDPGQNQKMSGGERGCAHSHRRLWEVAAKRATPTLVLEDDAKFEFERSDADLGQFNGKLFTERLCLALKEASADFDVLYLGWSGWRGGHFKISEEEATGEVLRKVEYVWTTVAYVISPAGAQKLLAAGTPVNQPVDNFMAWEASQGRLNSFVVLDAGDADDTWAGGIVDQVDFQGDSDIKKSDGGIQGDDANEFAEAEA